MSLYVSIPIPDESRKGGIAQLGFDIDRLFWCHTNMPTGVYIYNKYVDTTAIEVGEGTLQVFVRDAAALWSASHDEWFLNDTVDNLRRMAVLRLLKCFNKNLEINQIDVSAMTVKLMYQLLMSVCTRVLNQGWKSQNPIMVGTVHNTGDRLATDMHTGRVAVNDGRVLKIEWSAYEGASFDFLVFSGRE